jgi:L-fucose isomerase
MLFGKLLTNRAQIFADVRTYWSGDAVKRVTGYEIEGKAKLADGFIHLINSGAACVDACGEVKDENGNAIMKKWWEMTDKDIDTCMKATTWPYADLGYFRGGGYSSRFVTKAEMPVTMMRLNMVKLFFPFSICKTSENDLCYGKIVAMNSADQRIQAKVFY